MLEVAEAHLKLWARLCPHAKGTAGMPEIASDCKIKVNQRIGTIAARFSIVVTTVSALLVDQRLQRDRAAVIAADLGDGLDELGPDLVATHRNRQAHGDLAAHPHG